MSANDFPLLLYITLNKLSMHGKVRSIVPVATFGSARGTNSLGAILGLNGRLNSRMSGFCRFVKLDGMLSGGSHQKGSYICKNHCSAYIVT